MLTNHSHVFSTSDIKHQRSDEVTLNVINHDASWDFILAFADHDRGAPMQTVA